MCAGKLKYGMVGGGEGAFIADIHRKGAAFDQKCELVSGCFSRTYENTLRTGKMLGIEERRLYPSFEAMAASEANQVDGIDFVTIVTPNQSHYEIAKVFLQHGIHVVCDKPLTLEAAQAEELAELAVNKQLLLCVTYAYSGYPMVKQAREMIKLGELGEIRTVAAEYLQEGLANPRRVGTGWRMDPVIQGKSLVVGDIGCHIEHTVAYITGLKIKALCAQFDHYATSPQQDSNAQILIRYTNGASGMYWCSKIAIGCKNGLKIRIYGSKGSIEWEQENPNELKVAIAGQPNRILARGRDRLHPHAESFNRLPGGHPEGTYESFANLYLSFANALLNRKDGGGEEKGDTDFPNAYEGLESVKFIGKCVESAQHGSTWVTWMSEVGVQEERGS